MNYASIKNVDIANGPGVRVSLFVSGCPHRCDGCFNPEAWDFTYGSEFTEKICDEVLALLRPDYVCGISLLGGEPLAPENQADVALLLRRIKMDYPDKSVWVYTGYLFEDLIAGEIGNANVVDEIMGYVDVLVDGPFIKSQKDLTIAFRGSSNQRLIDVKKSMQNNDTVLLVDC